MGSLQAKRQPGSPGAVALSGDARVQEWNYYSYYYYYYY